jgi:hypothetical protein
MNEDRQEQLTLWRLRTSQPGLVHIEDEATEVGVITLCGFEIPATANAMSSRQPADRVRSPHAPMCAACVTALDHIRKTNPNQI